MQPTIKVYGGKACGDCIRSKVLLEQNKILYQWIDVDQDAEALAYIRGINDGKRTIPTIVFPDGSVLFEPSNTELAQKCGLQKS